MKSKIKQYVLVFISVFLFTAASLNAVTFTSAKELGEWLSAQPDNTASTPYSVTLKISNSSGIRLALIDNKTKYVSLELSDCTSIATNDFFNCTSLISITIPKSVKTIIMPVFSGCKNLSAINVDVDNTVYCSDNGVLYYKDKGKLLHYPAGKTNASFTIPNSVDTIATRAFYECTNLTNVTIPNSVIGIEEAAFFGCTSLTSINIPNSITRIWNKTFQGCTNLTSVTIPNSVKSIGFNAFENCTSLTNITIPNSVIGIGESAFYSCTSLKSITIPNSVKSIEESTFFRCTGLTSVTMPNSVTSIGESAFYSCTSLISITIPNSVTSIGGDAFSSCTSLTSVTIPNSVTSIGDNSLDSITLTGDDRPAFSGCIRLTAINVDVANTKFSSDNGVLYDKNKTKLLQYPAGKTNTSFTIPNSITRIGEEAFWCCTSLTSVTIPNSVTRIGSNVFLGCTSLTAINVDVANNRYSSDNGVLYNKNKTALLQYPAGKTNSSFTVPDSVTDIGSSAFISCNNLASIVIPGSVTRIMDSAFLDCVGLTSVTFAGTIPSGRFNSDRDVFPGDLRDKFYADNKTNGTPGTYTRARDGKIWTKK
jgi:hypothetical protein